MRFSKWLENKGEKIFWTDYEIVSGEDEREIEELVRTGRLDRGGEIRLTSGERIHWDTDFAGLYAFRVLPTTDISKTTSYQHPPAIEKWHTDIGDAKGLNTPIVVYPDEWRGTTIYCIQDGHHRYEAASQHGLDKIPSWVKIADIV